MAREGRCESEQSKTKQHGEEETAMDGAAMNAVAVKQPRVLEALASDLW